MANYTKKFKKMRDFTDGIPFLGLPMRALYSGMQYNTKFRTYVTVNEGLKFWYDMYNRTDLDAYVYREKHSKDWIIGSLYEKANARDLLAEKEQMEADRKKNIGFNWRDNAYPRSAFGNAFGGSVGYASRSPLFDVNDAVLQLYGGVKKW